MAVNLVDVETAITAIQEGGQSFTLDGFTYTAGSLESLRKLRDTLRGEEMRSNGARPLFRRFKFTASAYGPSGDTSADIVRVR